MTARRFLLASPTILEACEKRIRDALATWRGQWVTGDIEWQVLCIPAAGTGTPFEHASEILDPESDGARWLSFVPQSQWETRLAALFDPERSGPPTPLESTVAVDAGNAMFGAIGAAFGLQAPPRQAVNGAPIAPAKHIGKGSGAVFAMAKAGMLKVSILISGAVAIAVTPGRPKATVPRRPLTPLFDAMQSATVALPVTAGKGRVSVGRLQSLKPGDVITLDRSIGGPLSVDAPREIPIGSAWLGSREGRKAVEFSPSATQ